jgi:DNA-binding transcriptional ArsR family regulator
MPAVHGSSLSPATKTKRGTRGAGAGRAGSSARVFAALGDETRLRLVTRLCDDGPASITRLTAEFRMSRQAVTKHLQVMERVGLVRNARHGRESVWRLEQRRIREAGHYLELISKQWEEALSRLQTFVEE